MEPMDDAWSLLKNEPTEGIPFTGGSAPNETLNIGYQGGSVTPFINLGARKKVDWEALTEIYGPEAVARAQRASQVLQFGAGAASLFSMMNSLGAEGSAPLSSMLSGGLMGAYGTHETVMAAEPWATERAAQFGMSPEKIQEGRERYRQKQEDERIDRAIAARNRRTQRENDDEAKLQTMAEKQAAEQAAAEQAAAGKSVAVSSPVASPTPIDSQNSQLLLPAPVAVAAPYKNPDDAFSEEQLGGFQ